MSDEEKANPMKSESEILPYLPELVDLIGAAEEMFVELKAGPLSTGWLTRWAAIIKRAKEIEHGTRAPQSPWIAVSERLPEEFRSVILSDYNHMESGYWSPTKEKFICQNSEYFRGDWDVWQNFPSLPQQPIEKGGV